MHTTTPFPPLRPLVVAFSLGCALPAFPQPHLIIPMEARSELVNPALHPYADVINTFLTNQPSFPWHFEPTGFTRAAYLPVIDSIARGLHAYQNTAGRIIDPVLNREHQYSTPAYAHAVSVLFQSGFASPADTALLNSGIRAMTAGITTMLPGNSVPDGHGDFYTVLLMLAFENFKGVVSPGQEAQWRTSLGDIPTSKYSNAAPNWTGFNMAGEFLRYKEGLTSVNWVQARMTTQISYMGLDGLYQDIGASQVERENVSNIGGNSFAYDNVARMLLGIIATGGYDGTSADSLRQRLWRGAWTGLLYQSSAGEVPTGMRSSHHLWNEAYAAVNYEMWAAQYAMAGRPDIAGAFKRAAHLSLSVTKQWLRPNGTGYVTKARYPITARWGYMSYAQQAQYNGLTASTLALAWQVADTTIHERPAPADLGGYALPVIPGFKKVFANAGGTYVEYDLRGDQSHNPTGLLRVHLKSTLPQLGPSDGAVGPADQDQGAQYRPQYPAGMADPSNLQNLSIGPGWPIGGGEWQVLAALTQIPEVTVLEQSIHRAGFRVRYDIGQGSTLHQTVMVDPSGVTVVDSVVGGTVESLRVFYPMLVSDGEESTAVLFDGSSVGLVLRNKGSRFSMVRPAVPLTRTNVARNHRNGRVEAAYADVPGRVAEYRITAWPEHNPVPVRGTRASAAAQARLDGGFLQVDGHGAHRIEVRDLSGRLHWSRKSAGPARHDLRDVSGAAGLRVVIVTTESGRTVHRLPPMMHSVGGNP